MGVFSFVGSQDTTTSKPRKMRKRDSLMMSMKITHLKLQKNTCYRNEFSSIVRNKSFHVISVHCNDPCSLIQEISDFKKSTFFDSLYPYMFQPVYICFSWTHMGHRKNWAILTFFGSGNCFFEKRIVSR